ncbi:MAG TPA: hypothetical protein VFJ97_02695 [Dermatophilaceae bacterium]|nr:hypothetical protein [Dermatophilaceae bacterium]
MRIASLQAARAAGAAGAALLLSGCVVSGQPASPAPSPSARPSAGWSTSPPAPTTAQLPRGGRTVFPAYRLVGFSGAPGSPALGRLGVGDLDDRVAEIERVGKAYAQGRQVLPVLELIATVVQAAPGRDGMYRTRARPAVLDDYLAAARRHRGLLLLNIQPGRADFLDEVRSYERWLREPDVGVALDPEWAVGPGQLPGRVFGRTSGAELDRVAGWLAALVRRYGLPEKVMVYHQLHASIVAAPAALRPHTGVALVQSVDGIGSRGDKEATWRRVVARKPPSAHPGFKLFYEEDRRHGRLMTPAQVLALRPTPEYVLYE